MAICSPVCLKWTTFSVSVIFIILGVLLATLWQFLISSIVKRELSLANAHTEGYSMWKETPIPMYLEFYLFNWTNSEDVIKNPSVKPIFTECGPYAYHEHHIRENITFNDNNTVTFFTRRIWRYLPDKSVGSLTDNITTFNPIVATVANIVKNKHAIVKMGVNFFLEEKNVKLAITKTVDEFIFKGYDDPLLDLVHKLNISGMKVPYDKFGWFVERNDSVTYDGIFNIYTGADQIEKLGLMYTWNYQTKTPFYNEECAEVNGTTGELWYPPHDKQSVKLFATDLCSSVELDWNGIYNLHGVDGHKYIGTNKIFDNGTVYPEMKCFIPDHTIQPSGVRNVSLCKFGAPALVSYAHFYQADPFYREGVIGMKPDKTKHEMYLVLEPNTGMPLKVQAIFQINLLLQRVDHIKMLEKVTPTLLPAFWFKQTAEMSTELVNKAKLLLVLPSVGQYTGFGFIAIGLLIGVIAFIITYKKGWQESEEESLLNQNRR